jgi:hypothetical protein
MRCSVFSVVLFLLMGCASDYKLLKQIPADAACRDVWKPGGLSTTWYKASVDVVGKYISGLLLVKEMPDRSTRFVFTNEAGITYFDFSFDSLGRFAANHVIRQLDKQAVITTLRKDFELWLGIPFRNATLSAWRDHDEVYYGVMQKKNTAFFVTDKNCANLNRLERGSERKRTVTLLLIGSSAAPDSVNFRHHTFDMNIALRKLERE